jgi:DNA-binding beta-propeller fold protein YncE
MDRGNNRVAHLSTEGQLLSTFGQLGRGPGDIYAGWDIELDAAGNIYICNLVAAEEGLFRAHDGVKVFSPQGQFLRELGGQDYDYEGDVQSHTPYGLDIDGQGRVFVAGFDSNAVRVFGANGVQLAAFFGERGSGEGQFKGMVDVAIDDQRGLLYATDQFNSRVQQFELSQTAGGDLTMTFRLSFGSYGRQAGQFAYLQNIVVDDQSGRVYVSDMGNRRIQIFDSEGQYQAEFSAPSDWQVIGLDLDEVGRLYATDALNNVIWIFELNGQVRRLEVEP